MTYLRVGAEASSHHVPSYFFSEVLKDWVVFHMDGKTRSYLVATQLILSADSELRLITQLPTTAHQSAVSVLDAAFRDENYRQDIRSSLPLDFGPRVVLTGTTTLVARSESDARRLREGLSKRGEAVGANKLLLGNSGDERHHFQWSRLKWARFSAKVAFEALCLFEGQHRCLSATFDRVREFVLRDASPAPRELVFSNTGPMRRDDVPLPVVLDLTLGQSAPESIPALIARCEPGMHLVMLYEISGWILASVVFAGFPASTIVLGGPGEHLEDIYQLVYDDEESGFSFVRLAYDPGKPVIKLPVAGNSMASLSETYRLKAV